MKRIQKLTDVLIQYPKAQARCCLRRFCYCCDAKINYWLRTQLSAHANRFVDDFRDEILAFSMILAQDSLISELRQNTKSIP